MFSLSIYVYMHVCIEVCCLYISEVHMCVYKYLLSVCVYANVSELRLLCGQDNLRLLQFTISLGYLREYA